MRAELRGPRGERRGDLAGQAAPAVRRHDLDQAQVQPPAFVADHRAPADGDQRRRRRTRSANRTSGAPVSTCSAAAREAPLRAAYDRQPVVAGRFGQRHAAGGLRRAGLGGSRRSARSARSVSGRAVQPRASRAAPTGAASGIGVLTRAGWPRVGVPAARPRRSPPPAAGPGRRSAAPSWPGRSSRPRARSSQSPSRPCIGRRPGVVGGQLQRDHVGGGRPARGRHPLGAVHLRQRYDAACPCAVATVRLRLGQRRPARRARPR